jgi:hypothetical protein
VELIEPRAKIGARGEGIGVSAVHEQAADGGWQRQLVRQPRNGGWVCLTRRRPAAGGTRSRC